MIKVVVQCSMCGSQATIEMTEDQYKKWKNQEDLIQNIFPNMSSTVRELLISGICGNCFDKLFPKEDN